MIMESHQISVCHIIRCVQSWNIICHSCPCRMNNENRTVNVLHSKLISYCKYLDSCILYQWLIRLCIHFSQFNSVWKVTCVHCHWVCCIIFVIWLMHVSVIALFMCFINYSISGVTIRVQNSFGSAMFTRVQSLRTIEKPTSAVVTSPLSSVTNTSLTVSWNAPSNVCGTLTGYSVYLESTQVCMYVHVIKCNSRNWHPIRCQL